MLCDDIFREKKTGFELLKFSKTIGHAGTKIGCKYLTISLGWKNNWCIAWEVQSADVCDDS